ncbi:flagellar brake protein [Aneurinibacillus tyrosinisolvens]|uniref:flagellar brake protein n=1 Tax=Aneurinibacillus tyrosinisolvens TaxID=1443435 RepID=UPI00063EEECB|nr:flagellar brake domain-containing protein [Aneurinibacillus tyrosinisolvens]
MMPKIGSIVYMQLRTADETESKKMYKSRVADMDEQHIVIEIPTEQNTGKAGFYPRGSEFSFWFTAEDGAQYSFITAITGRKNENIPLILISRPQNDRQITRSQRRNYFRVPAELDVSLQRLDPERPLHFVAKTNDIGGGGISFVCDASVDIQVGDRFTCWIVLPMNKGIEHTCFHGDIVRIIPPAERKHPQVVSLSFFEIKDGEREKVISYSLERQIYLRNRVGYE